MEWKIGKFKIRLKPPELSVASVIAAILSWITNKSILWCVVHYFLGLFYIIYWLIIKLFFI